MLAGFHRSASKVLRAAAENAKNSKYVNALKQAQKDAEMIGMLEQKDAEIIGMLEGRELEDLEDVANADQHDLSSKQASTAND